MLLVWWRLACRCIGYVVFCWSDRCDTGQATIRPRLCCVRLVWSLRHRAGNDQTKVMLCSVGLIVATQDRQRSDQGYVLFGWSDRCDTGQATIRPRLCCVRLVWSLRHRAGNDQTKVMLCSVGLIVACPVSLDQSPVWLDQTNQTQHNLHNHMQAATIPVTSTNIEIFNNFIYRNIYSLMMIRKDWNM